MPSIGPLSKNPFDSFHYSEKEITPLWTIREALDAGEDKEEDVLTWLNNAVEACEDYYKQFFQTQMDNLLLYKGCQWINQDKYSNRFLDRQGVITRRSPRVVINHLFDFVEQWRSRLTRYRPAVAVYPASSEQQDADDAKISKDVLDFIWYTNNIDRHLQDFVLHLKVFGEAYLYPKFDFTKGDLHPDYIQARDLGLKIPVTDKEGNPIVSEKGDPLILDTPVRLGDVVYELDAPWHTYDMPCGKRDDIDWSIKWQKRNIDYIKAKYPDKADKIKADTGSWVFQSYNLDVGKLKNEVIEYTLFHKHHEFMEKGRYIKWVKGAVLENTIHPYNHGQLPYLHMADIDIPDQIRGMSFFQQLFPIQHQINAVSSLIYKALVLYAHPKIAFPENSCDIQQLLNESTTIGYSGGVPPTLLTNSPVSGELFTYLNKLEETAEKLSGVFTFSRGQAPSGVRAAKALRAIEEQEDKRAYITATKYNNICLVENAKMTLSLAGQFYDDEDGRLARIVGKDNEFRIRNFKQANLSKAYDIRIDNTTALSQSPAARIEEINEMMNVRFDPAAPISREQYYRLLGLTALDEFKDIVTRAVNCALSENDDMLSGVEVSAPTPDEDLIQHWKVHYQVTQGRDFKEKVDPQRKAILQRHQYVTEYLMFKKAYGITDKLGMPLSMPNMAFQQKLLMECPDFPLYFKMPLPPMPMGMPMGNGAPLPEGEVPMDGVNAQPMDMGMPPENGASPTPPPVLTPPLQ